MSVCENLSYLWHLCPGLKVKEEYISKDVVNPYNISSTQKSTAKKAIIWILSKTSHSVEEIAEHFEISPELVKHLLNELTEAKIIAKSFGRTPRYNLINKEKSINN